MSGNSPTNQAGKSPRVDLGKVTKDQNQEKGSTVETSSLLELSLVNVASVTEIVMAESKACRRQLSTEAKVNSTMLVKR